MNSKEKAKEIIRKAERRGKKIFAQYKDSLRDRLIGLSHSERKDSLRQLAKETKELLKKPIAYPSYNYMPFYDLGKYGPERLAEMLAKGNAAKELSNSTLEHRIAVAYSCRLLIDYLEGLLGEREMTVEELLKVKPKRQKEDPGNEDLAQIVREALNARGMLQEGKFVKGNVRDTTTVKALYKVLFRKGHLQGAYPEDRFAEFFLQYFGFRITGRTLQNTANKGQKKEEDEFRTLIP